MTTTAGHISFPREKIRVLLLEAIHPAAAESFLVSGYTSVEMLGHSPSEEALRDLVAPVHILGIRSKTRITPGILERARHLLAIGCYCIGTDQVALEDAASLGVAVFNAPFSNTRSVAELTVAEIVMLTRRAAHKSLQLHQGAWDKSAAGCHEVRHKTVGIVGYGHIGPQVGLLAEAFGMRVVFYDIAAKLALGNAVQLSTLAELLNLADFITLHVPDTPLTRNMVGAPELAAMKKGSYLINTSRGRVVDLDSLAAALRSGHLAGAAIDVFPEEPESNRQGFDSPLCGLENVILTPHIGGSTEEAQRNIALEVSAKLARYSDTGSSTGAVNFPEVELPLLRDSHRILNIHSNVPGVLRDITRIIADVGGNINAQYLSTRLDIGYLIMDIDRHVSLKVKKSIEALETSIRTRVLF